MNILSLIHFSLFVILYLTVYSYGIELHLDPQSDSAFGLFTLDIEGSKGKVNGVKLSKNYSPYRPGEKYFYLFSTEQSLGPISRVSISCSFKRVDYPDQIIRNPTTLTIHHLKLKYLSNIDQRY